MKRAAWALAALLAVASSASAAVPLDPTKADADVARARDEGFNAFCTKPARPVLGHAQSVCGLAHEVEGCQALVDACAADAALFDRHREPPKPSRLGEAFARFFARAAQAAIWLLVLAVILALAIPVIRALLHARRDVALADDVPPPEAPEPSPLAAEATVTATDAELLLLKAEGLAREGALDRAAVTFLHAALRALDQRGAIRIARHRTHGDYVRSCKDAAARGPLREIVREVDRVEFGGERPSESTVAHIAARARMLVRAAPTVMMLLLVAIVSLTGVACSGHGEGALASHDDPAGDDLLLEVLRRQGKTVGRLGGSLATLPLPDHGAAAPIVVVDAERVPLEDETRVHLVRWVEAGGVLVVAGDVGTWPEAFAGKPAAGASTDVTVSVPSEDDEDEDDDAPVMHFEHARIARAAALTMRAKGDANADAWATLAGGETYAAARVVGDGLVLGLANDDLLTNVGLARKGNAAALVALVAAADRGGDVRVARPQDGISPPSNPLSALARAGLGLGIGHAFAATLLLFLAVGIRLVRPRPSPPPARRAFAEHVVASGALYARTRAATHALAVYARYADERVRARMPRGATDPATFLAARSGADPATCEDLWSRAMRARAGEKAATGDDLAVLKHLSALVTSALFSSEAPKAEKEKPS